MQELEHEQGPAARAGEERRRGEQQLVVFTLGQESYGVEITTVREIITMQKITPIPEAPSFVEGMINLRGRVVPVIDLKKRLGLPAAKAGQETRIMVVDMGSTTIGCIVDVVKEVLTISTELVEPPEAAVGIQAEFLEGIAKVGDALVILVDLRRVLSAEKLAELQPETPVTPARGM